MRCPVRSPSLLTRPTTHPPPRMIFQHVPHFVPFLWLQTSFKRPFSSKYLPNPCRRPSKKMLFNYCWFKKSQRKKDHPTMTSIACRVTYLPWSIPPSNCNRWISSLPFPKKSNITYSTYYNNQSYQRIGKIKNFWYNLFEKSFLTCNLSLT